MRTLSTIVVLVALVAAAGPARAGVDAAWWPGFGLGPRGGARFAEEAIGSRWIASPVLGLEIDAPVVALDDAHHLGLVAGADWLFASSRKGSREVWVETDPLLRFDLAAAYRFVWRLLLVEARLGAGLTLIESRTVLADVPYEVFGNELIYGEPVERDATGGTGASLGLLVGLGVGLALLDDALELVVGADYDRRGTRDDFALRLAVRLRPLSF